MEQSRLQAVRKFEHFAFDLNKGLEDVLFLATELCETPVAFITLIDEESQWFKVCRGMEVMQMPRQASFCNYTIQQDGVLVVPDPTKDDRFAHLPLVANEPHIRFYAGAPLKADDGSNIGTLCVYDAKAKELPEAKQNLLALLARQAIHLMELELCIQLLNSRQQHIERQNKVLMEIAFTQAHEFRGPLTAIMGFMNIIRDENYESPREHLEMMEQAVAHLDEKIVMVVQSTQIARQMVLG